MNKIHNKIIIWSIDDFNTLGLMRELGPYGFDMLFLVHGKHGIACASKYCTSFVETETIEEGFDYLKNNYKNEEYKPIIIISSDSIITYVDEHSSELEGRFILPICGIAGNSKKYTDKNTMTSLAQEIGILCPDSMYVKWDSDINNVKYPCLIKPSHQRPGHYNEFKFKICKTKRALMRTLKYVHHDSVFILQDYINKEKDILIYGARMLNQETILAGAMIRDRLADSGSSSHGLLTANIPASVDTSKIIEFLDRIDYYGLFSFEFGMIGDKAYFFEVNLRNDGTSDYFNQAGANIPLAYIYSCANLDYKVLPLKVKKDAWFLDEVFDYENVLKHSVSKKQWKKEKAEATIFKYYNEDDMGPYKIVYKSRHKQIIQDFILKKFRIYIVFVLDRLGLRK